MISLSVAEIARATCGDVFNQASAEMRINAVCSDSRNMNDGSLFIALQGPSFDAHDFLHEVENSAALLLVHRKVTTHLPYILVKDTRIALGRLAAHVRNKIVGLKCAAITGSNGKTTTKELLSQILREFDPTENAVLATAGNFNNDIGLPLTLLRLTEQNHFAVVELGANHLGEIAYTAQLAKPDVALINNVMPAHLEGFGSLAGVAKAKGEIWGSLSDRGIAVLNLDADFANDYRQQIEFQGNKIISFSMKNSEANLYADHIHYDALGKPSFTLNINHDNAYQRVDIVLNIAGQHNISNALAAASMAIALGCNIDSIRLGLNNVSDVSGRVNSIQLNEFITLIDDTYNANSASVKAAIDLLALQKGKNLLILGDMGELGQYSVEQHIAVGIYAAEKKIDQLLTVGTLSADASKVFNQYGEKTAKHFMDKNDLHNFLLKLLSQRKKITILVKGSRSAKMEETVGFIKQASH